MLPRFRRKEYYYDRLHKGFVTTCIAITIVGGINLLYAGYVYFTRILPEKKLLIRQKEEELLTEGQDIEDSVPA